MEPVVSSKVTNEAERINFLPQHLPLCFGIFESSVYHWFDRYAKDYSSSYYNFYTLSNGSFFIAPDQGYALDALPNGFQWDEVSAEACGIIACLYILNGLSFHFHEKGNDEQLELVTNYYYQLRDYALSHKESDIILGAID